MREKKIKEKKKTTGKNPTKKRTKMDQWFVLSSKVVEIIVADGSGYLWVDERVEIFSLVWKRLAVPRHQS